MKKTFIGLAIFGFLSFGDLTAAVRNIHVPQLFVRKVSSRSRSGFYYATFPDKTNNLSSKGNYNFFTGRWGTKNPW